MLGHELDMICHISFRHDLSCHVMSFQVEFGFCEQSLCSKSQCNQYKNYANNYLIFVILVVVFDFSICFFVHVCRGSGLTPPKIYKGPSAGGEDNMDGKIDADGSSAFSPNSAAVCSEVDRTSADSETDGDFVTSPSRERHTTLTHSFDADDDTDDSMSDKQAGDLLTRKQDGVGDPLIKVCDENVHARHVVCDDDTALEDGKSLSSHRPSGDDADVAVERFKESEGDSAALPSREKSFSPPVDIPGSASRSDAEGVLNGGEGSPTPRCHGPAAVDSKPSTCEAGSIPQPLPFYIARRRSMVSNFTPAGSFIIPADEDIYVDYSSGLFSTNPGDIGRVQDVSTLPSPPQKPFTIGDTEQTDLVYYEGGGGGLSGLTRSCQAFSLEKFSSDTERAHSDGEISKPTSSSDLRVEMVDATSREVLDEIFKRTSGRFFPCFFMSIA